MKRLLFIVLAGIALCACWIAWSRYADAQRQFAAAQAQLTAVTHDVNEVIELRGREQRVAERKPPERDVIARVNEGLARAGLPSSVFASLSPESNAALPGSTIYHRQTLRLSLRGLDIPGVGAFLGAWRTSQSMWTISQIDLTHSRERDCESCYDVTMLLSAIYVQGGDA